MVTYREDRGSEMKLCEMALNKQLVELRLLDNLELVILHLMCIYLFPKNREVNHWKTEVRSLMRKTYKCKSTKKYLPESRLKELLLSWCDSFDDHFDGYIEEVKDKMKLKVLSVDKSSVKEFMSDYFIWVAHQFSRHGEVLMQDVSEEIDMLLGEYK